jgi:hypothetical protein
MSITNIQPTVLTDPAGLNPRSSSTISEEEPSMYPFYLSKMTYSRFWLPLVTLISYKRQTDTDVSKNNRAMGKLKREVEKAKRTLSSQMSTKIEIEAFENGNDFSEVCQLNGSWTKLINRP